MRSLFLLLSFFIFPLFSEIIEIKYISEMEKYLEDKPLIVFDIDNTIMCPVQTVGSDQWFNHRIKKHEKEGYTSHGALEKAISEWMAVQCITDMKLVEKHTSALIKDLQDKGHTIIALTTRDHGFSLRTLQQLKSLDVHLERTCPSKEEIYFKNDQHCIYRQGILFTAGSHKGTALKKLLAELRLQPKKILFINDKHNHLTPVEEICKKEKIAFIGLRYGFLDERVNAFSPELADLQFEKFKTLLSDEQAEKEMTQKSEEKKDKEITQVDKKHS
ncbi:MAG TPA: DUF2608 domain-containing protein [Chlamydiales bacterium]|nr:DUF2608 domain-containing protein [Chlamydiales bacterium]